MGFINQLITGGHHPVGLAIYPTEVGIYGWKNGRVPYWPWEVKDYGPMPGGTPWLWFVL